ncbi:MAG TPA: sulfite exporter TauE/SafE family protein [Dermatophilaceae bacterium]|nr:sulfite exporter TauE/SafE family protein [Dermatophilaceae bacterium]
MPLLAVPLGLLVGLALGALGGGGSILTVPALVHALGQDPRAAITGSLLIVGASAVIGLVPHAREGNVRGIPGLVFGLLGTAGSFAGSALSARVPPEVLLTAFAALMFVVAALMFRRSRREEEDDRDDGDAAGTGPVISLRPWTCDCARVGKVLLTATAVGMITGFFGVGGGFALVPALVLALGFAMPVAIGTSLLVIAINSATAFAARLGSASALDLPLLAVFTAAAIAGSLVGGRVTARADPQKLGRAFAVLLIAVALYTAARSVPMIF